MITKTEENRITKYEADLLRDAIGVLEGLDKNKEEFKFTYSRKTGKYDLVVRTETEKEETA